MAESLIQRYFAHLKHQHRDPASVDPGFLAYLANLDLVAGVTPNVAASIVRELIHQRTYIKFIASENYSSLAVQAAMGNLLTDKYAEGAPPNADEPARRFYAGCENVDDIESFACAQACRLFGAEHAYVQPHSGADANMIAFWAVLTARVQTPALERLGLKSIADLTREQWASLRAELGNQRLLAMDFSCGGHLSHGYRLNVSAKMFDAHSYMVDRSTGLLDYDVIERQAREVKPLILLAGYSAYSRRINFRRMREIADAVGAVLMVDMAHFAGLVAGKVFDGDEDPVRFADIVTSTTHKTLRGPRGGIILCKKYLREYVDRGCPLVIGGPLPHVMAAKAVCFTEALRPDFQTYARQVVDNARALADACAAEGLQVLTGGTDNHLVLVNVSPYGITGWHAEAALRRCRITLNRNAVPFDTERPEITSGLRFGTAAVTTLGMKPPELKRIAAVMADVLRHTRPETLTSGPSAGKPSKKQFTIDDGTPERAALAIRQLLDQFPVYPVLDLGFLSDALLPESDGAAVPRVPDASTT